MLHAWATDRVPAARLTLVSPEPELTYSGMLPGLVAGHYEPADCTVPVEALAAKAGATFVRATATAIDAAARRVMLALPDGAAARLDYDLLSVDVGGTIAREAIAGMAEHAEVVRPIEDFVAALGRRLDKGAQPPGDVVVVGGGAGGFELAAALCFRLGGAARVHVVTGGPPLLAGYPVGIRRRALRAFRERAIAVHEEPCVAIEADAVRLASGARLPCDLAVVAIGTSAPRWLRSSGLALDPDGYLATGPTLQSVSDARVFAAGDVATRLDAPRPRSGVYAVRAGPPLARNLRAALEGRALETYMPQKNALSLLSCGSRTAIASWGGGSVEGRAVWWLKDWIDRRFVAVHGGGLSRAA